MSVVEGEPPAGAAPAPSTPVRSAADVAAVRGLAFIVFFGGVSSLGAEIAAARLMAPYFGASTIIWANTIGIVLVALSVGYWYGGRLADRHPNQERLRWTVLLAAVLIALIPLVAGPFLDIAVDAFDSIDAGAAIGSFVGILVLLAVPIFLVGTITPWALRLSISKVESAGEVAGRLYALSTVGSLSGVFLSALVLIPLVGTQRSFIAFAFALAAAAAVGGGMPRRALAAPLLILALLALPPGVTKPGGAAGATILEERDSTYQYMRVLERGDRRTLELNEGQAVHSVYEPDTVLTDGVWDGYLTAPLTVLDGPPRSMAMLGNAAGTVSRAYGRYFPQTQIDGVEIDGDVTEIGREYFDLGANANLETYTEDARPFLRRIDRRYDLIGIDAYRQPYIPFYLATVEFFELARDRLTPGGVVVINVGHPPGEDALEETLTKTAREVFPHVARFPIEDENTLLIASMTTPPSAERLRRQVLPPDLEPLRERTASQLAGPLSGGRIYTDDKAPVEWLIDTSIVSYATGDGADDRRDP
jgi:spermidine synthase